MIQYKLVLNTKANGNKKKERLGIEIKNETKKTEKRREKDGKISRKIRVGHRILFCSVRSVLFRSLKERSVLFLPFFEFLATYETQNNVPFFSILF